MLTTMENWNLMRKWQHKRVEVVDRTGSKIIAITQPMFARDVDGMPIAVLISECHPKDQLAVEGSSLWYERVDRLKEVA